MAIKVIDFGSRFQSAFGYVSNNTGDDVDGGFNKALSGAQVYSDASDTSFEALSLVNGGTALKFGFKGFKKPDDSLFAPPPMCSFNRSKRIETTILDGDAGEVIERYGTDPWKVTIQGIVIDLVEHKYPSAKVKQLREMFDVNDTWAVENQMFLDLNIKTIYIASMDVATVQGFEDTIAFTLNCSSIKPVEFFLKKRK